MNESGRATISPDYETNPMNEPGARRVYLITKQLPHERRRTDRRRGYAHRPTRRPSRSTVVDVASTRAGEDMSGLRAVAVAGVLTLGDQVGPAGAVGVAELPAPLFDAVGEVM